MGRASHGGSCPLCSNYASRTAAGKLYWHRGSVLKLIGAGFRECQASGVRFEIAQAMRANKDAGRYPQRNADGTWLYICDRCGREQIPWDIVRPGRCSPARWAHCVRPLSDEQTTEARNEE